MASPVDTLVRLIITEAYNGGTELLPVLVATLLKGAELVLEVRPDTMFGVLSDKHLHSANTLENIGEGRARHLLVYYILFCPV